MYSPEAQQWLSDLCQAAESADWYSPASDDCLMDRFVAWMETDCSGSHPTCCGYNATDFPYDETTAETCIRQAALLSANENWGPGGFWFKVEGNRDLKALVLTFESNIEVRCAERNRRVPSREGTHCLPRRLGVVPGWASDLIA